MEFNEIIKTVMSVKKVSASELSYSLKCSEKTINKWADLKKSPSKRKLKLLALFCGVTEEKLLNGEVTAVYGSDSENTKEITLSETEVENLSNYRKFARKRNPLSKLTTFTLFFLSLLATLVVLFHTLYSISKVFLFKTNLVSPTIFSLAVIAPVLIILMQHILSFPLVKHPFSYKRFSLTKASIPFIFAASLFAVAPFAFNYLNIYTTLLVLSAVIFAVLLSHISVSEKFKQKYKPAFNFIFYIPVLLTISAFLALVYILPDRTKATTAFYETAAPLNSVLFCLIFSALTTGRVFANYFKTSYLKQFFHPLPLEKNISKKRIGFSLISALTLIVCISLVLFIAPKNASRVFLASMKLTFLNGQPAVAQDFSEYDTSFADGESTEVNFVDFTMELPAEFKLKAKTEHSETYVSQNKKIIISTSPDKESESIQYDIISYLRKISPATNQEKLILSEEAVEAHFGFIPSSKTDYERFYRALEKNKKFPLTKELATGIFYCYAQYSNVFSEKHFDSDTRLLYDKNNIDGILVKSNEAESVTTFNFDFEIVNPPSYPYTVTIYYNNAKPDMKEVYKIINSINNT